MAMDTEYCALCYKRFPQEKYRYYLCSNCSRALKQAKKDKAGIQLEIDRRLLLFNNSCAYCSGYYRKEKVWDHIIPKRLLSSYFGNIGERDVFALGMGYNFVPTCKLCNSAKSGRDLTWMFAYRHALDKGSFRLSALEQIIFRHQFAPDHWLDFLIRARVGVIAYDDDKVRAWECTLPEDGAEKGEKRHWQEYVGSIFKVGDRIDGIPGLCPGKEGAVVNVKSVAGQEVVTVYMHGGKLIETTVDRLLSQDRKG